MLKAPLFIVLIAAIISVGWSTALAADKSAADVEGVIGFLNIMEKYVTLTGQMQDIAADDTRTAGFAVFQLKDLYEDAGRKDEVVEVFQEILKETGSKPVRNLIKLQLADMLKKSGKSTEAIRVLRELIRENAK